MPFEDFPFIVGWELTLACNLVCRHCGSSAGSQRPCELTTDEALALCDQFPDLLVQEVDFTGGEPLMHPGWFTIASHLHDLGIDTKLISNGLLLNQARVRQLQTAGVSGIGVSLDGTQAIHDAVRGRPGLYLDVINAIQRCIASGMQVTVLTTVNALNLACLPEMLESLVRLGVKWWQLQPIFHFGRGQSASDLHLSEQQYLALGAFVRDYDSKARAAGLEIAPADSYGYFTAYDFRQPPWGGCSAGRHGFGITSDGRIKGCLSLPDELTEGTVRERDLWSLWFDPTHFAFSRGFTPAKLGPNCQGCAMANQCRGGCTAMSYGCTGRFWNNPYCFTGINARQSALPQLDPSCERCGPSML